MKLHKIYGEWKLGKQTDKKIKNKRVSKLK